MNKLVWFIALIAVACITVFAQLDRQSRISPQIAGAVPESFASFALRHRAAASVSQGEAVSADSTARSLVARRPMPAENLRLFAQARALSGDEKVAAAATLQAARRGWRDPVAQRAMMEMALAAGDHREAARRLAALWARAPDRATLQPLATRVLSHEEARAEMARLLSEGPRWQESFERVAPDIVDHAIIDEIRRLQEFEKPEGS